QEQKRQRREDPGGEDVAQRGERGLGGRGGRGGRKRTRSAFRGRLSERCPRAPLERFHVCSFVLDQPVGSGRRVVGAARPRGDELGALFWRQGEQLADTIQQGVQVVVHKSVDPIASRQRPIQPHQRFVAMVQCVE